jgi:methane/ammonia monooxygenase subunit C
MSSTTSAAAGAAAEVESVVDLRGMWIGLAVLNLFYLLVRIYEQIYGWRAGLDSFAPEFQTYWMSILWTEIPLELVFGLGLAGYLWKTRDRNVDAVSPREEMRRLVVLVQWLVVYGVAIYWGASFFTEQDGTGKTRRRKVMGLQSHLFFCGHDRQTADKSQSGERR